VPYNTTFSIQKRGSSDCHIIDTCPNCGITSGQKSVKEIIEFVMIFVNTASPFGTLFDHKSSHVSHLQNLGFASQQTYREVLQKSPLQRTSAKKAALKTPKKLKRERVQNVTHPQNLTFTTSTDLISRAVINTSHLQNISFASHRRYRQRPTVAVSGVKHCKQASYEIQPETAESRQQTCGGVLQEPPLQRTPAKKAALKTPKKLKRERAQNGTHTKLRSIDIERFTPKFLKNWETQLFQKSLGIRCSIGYTRSLRCGLLKMPAFFYSLTRLNIQFHYAGISSRRLIPTRNLLIASCYHPQNLTFTTSTDLISRAVINTSHLPNIIFASHRRCRLRPTVAGSGVKHCKQASYEIKPETAESREQTYRGVLREAQHQNRHLRKAMQERQRHYPPTSAPLPKRPVFRSSLQNAVPPEKIQPCHYQQQNQWLLI